MQEGEERMEQNCLKKRYQLGTVFLKLLTPTQVLNLGSQLQIKDIVIECLIALCSCAFAKKKVLWLLKPTVVWLRWWHWVTNVVMSFPAVLSDRLILLSFLEQSQVAAVYLGQKNQDSPETSRRTDKLSPSEIKVQWNLIRESAGALKLVCMEERKVGGGKPVTGQ